MIQTKGVIVSQDGVSEYKDALININFYSYSKFYPTMGIAQVGKILGAGETERFNVVAEVGAYKYVGPNPSFEEVQATVLAGLRLDYPQVTFTII